MSNLKGHFVLIGVAALGVALILIAILLPPGEVSLPPESEQRESLDGSTDEGAQAQQRTRPIEPADEPAHVRLLRAAAAGDTQTIGSLVGMGVAVDTAASQADVDAVASPPLEVGATALMLAARDSDAPTVNILLEAGADPNAQADSGVGALAMAAQRGRTDNVVVLLGAGANPGLRTTDGRTPLMLAARAGAEQAVALLIEAGAEVDATDADGATALMHAAGGQHLDAVIVLLGSGADVAAVDARGRAALDRAGDRGPIADVLREAAGG